MDQRLPVYVFIAANKAGGASCVGTTRSLLEMPWIATFGVDNLVWFEGCTDRAQADERARTLSEMTETERQAVFLSHNPEREDLTPRIWASDPD